MLLHAQLERLPRFNAIPAHHSVLSAPPLPLAAPNVLLASFSSMGHVLPSAHLQCLASMVFALVARCAPMDLSFRAAVMVYTTLSVSHGQHVPLRNLNHKHRLRHLIVYAVHVAQHVMLDMNCLGYVLEIKLKPAIRVYQDIPSPLLALEHVRSVAQIAHRASI